MVMFMVGFIIGLLAVAAVIGGLSLIGAIAGAIYGFFKGLFGQPDIPAKNRKPHAWGFADIPATGDYPVE